MNSQQELNQIFLQNINSIRKQQLIKMLRCIICQGLFRFAHTIVDCGHTFCQVCIFTYIKGFKGRNPSIKCPQCHAIVDNNYKKSIIKDVFKQTLVDTIAPQFVVTDHIIMKRIQELFPDFNLEYVQNQFRVPITNGTQATFKQNRKKIDNNISVKLIEKVKQKLNLTFETFCQMIAKEENFNNFLTIIQNAPDPKIIEIKPKNSRDFSFIGINNQMKTSSLNVLRLQRFIQKKALEKIDKTQQVPEQWLNTDDNKLDIKIFLSINGKCIQSEDDLEDLLRIHRGHPILYSLTK